MAKKIIIGLLCVCVSLSQLSAVRHPNIASARPEPDYISRVLSGVQAATNPADYVQQRVQRAYSCGEKLAFVGAALAMCAIELELIILATHKCAK
jgi:hypothetical protein